MQTCRTTPSVARFWLPSIYLPPETPAYLGPPRINSIASRVASWTDFSSEAGPGVAFALARLPWDQAIPCTDSEEYRSNLHDATRRS